MLASNDNLVGLSHPGLAFGQAMQPPAGGLKSHHREIHRGEPQCRNPQGWAAGRRRKPWQLFLENQLHTHGISQTFNLLQREHIITYHWKITAKDGYHQIPTIWSSHENNPDQSCLGQDLRISKPLLYIGMGHGMPWGQTWIPRTCNTKTVTTVGFSSVISWPPTSNADYSCTLVLMSFYTPRARQTWIRSVVNLDIFI